MASGLNKIRISKMVGNGTARKVVLGFKPKQVELENITDRIGVKKTETMELKKGIKTIADGTRTYVDSITIENDGFRIEAAEFVVDKEYHYTAFEAKND